MSNTVAIRNYQPVSTEAERGLKNVVYRMWSIKKGAFKNSAKFTGKHLCQSLFFNKVAGLRLILYPKLTIKTQERR